MPPHRFQGLLVEVVLGDAERQGDPQETSNSGMPELCDPVSSMCASRSLVALPNVTVLDQSDINKRLPRGCHLAVMDLWSEARRTDGDHGRNHLHRIVQCVRYQQ